MSEFKGTKGKWNLVELSAKPPLDRCKVSRVLTEDGKKIIGKVFATHTKKGNANANLIAVAPEMLKALQELTHLHQCEQEGLTSGQPSPDQWFKAVDKAEKVIQKALGHDS